MIRCAICGEDINLKGEDNVSPIPGCPVCESCAAELTEKDWNQIRELYEEDEE